MRKFGRQCQTNIFYFCQKGGDGQPRGSFSAPKIFSIKSHLDPRVVSHTSGSFIARFGLQTVRSFADLTVIMSDYGHDDDVEET